MWVRYRRLRKTGLVMREREDKERARRRGAAGGWCKSISPARGEGAKAKAQRGEGALGAGLRQ